MRFITFKALKAKNFLSFGDKLTSIDLKSGVNAITGINLDKEDSKNGAGKSAITEILHYGLYGATLREINKDHIQNSITKKRPEIHVEFDITTSSGKNSYKIIRKLDPTKCQLFRESEEITRSTLAKTNKLIQDLIRTPSTVFQNSVIMSANNASPFMALSKVDKRKFIESVLGLEVFTQMLLKVRDDYSIAKKDYEIAYNKLEQQESELKFNAEQLQNYEQSKQERLDKLKEREINTAKDIEHLQLKNNNIHLHEISNYQQQVEDLNNKLKNIQDLSLELLQNESKNKATIEAECKQIKKYQDNKLSCPTCNREFSETHAEHIQELIAEHNKTIKELQEKNELTSEQLNKLNIAKQQTEKQVQDIKISYTEEQNKNNEIQTTNNSILHLKDNLKQIQEEASLVLKEHNNILKGKITQLTENVNEIKEITNNLNNDLNTLETVKFILSEEGIKSFIVKKILQILNSRLAFYLQKLEANCLCQFNEFFDEVIVDEKSEPKSYFNFSGGERKRIDLACLFAFADVRRLQGDVYFSTVFYDELLDSSLDDKGVSLTFNVLQDRFEENNESCYIITHRRPEMMSNVKHVINVVKQNGVSMIKS